MPRKRAADLDQAGPKANMFPPETVRLALETAARTHGNTRQAARELMALGVRHPHTGKPISRGTIRGWMDKTHHEQYLHIRDVEMSGIYAKHSDSLHRRFVEADENEEKANGRLSKALDDDKIEPRDLPGAVRNIATQKAIAFDKMRIADELPSHYDKQPDISEILRALKAEGFPIPEAMEQAIDAEVVEPKQIERTDGDDT